MLGVGRGRERDGARGDGPDADVGKACDARGEDGDESEHVSCPLAATRTGRRLGPGMSDSGRMVGMGT